MRHLIVRRSPAILLLLLWVMLGSGALAYLHELEHAREDSGNGVPVEHRHHDDGNCRVHAQLHTPLTTAAVVALVPHAELAAEVSKIVGQRFAEGPRLTNCMSRAPPAC